MKCPYCNNDMKKGYLQANGTAIIWDTKKHKLMAAASEEGLSLSFGFNLSTIDNVYSCKECKKIIFEYIKYTE